MFFRWLKTRLPHGLFGRAALILIVPIAVLQLSLTVDFTQRYFTDVTQQLTESTALAIEALYSAHQSGDLGHVANLSQTLQIDLRSVDTQQLPQTNGRKFYDLSGVQVERVLRQRFPETLQIWLGEPRLVRLYIPDQDGVLQMSFSRKRVSPINTHQFVLATFFIALLMAVIGIVFLRNQLKPIAQLAEVADAFGRGETRPYRIRGATEVRAAGRAFLDMRARIARHIDQRTLMLTSISHDLRTPLTRMRLQSAMLPKEDAAPLVQDIEEMTQMIESFLTFAQNNAEPNAHEQFDLHRLIADIVAQENRVGHDIRFATQTEERIITARPSDLKRAITNLISNAKRFATVIEISTECHASHTHIIVEDNGPGISEHDIERAVLPFERLDSARSQAEDGGVGLGLAIVSDIARAHGGKLALSRSVRLGGLKAEIIVGS